MLKYLDYAGMIFALTSLTKGTFRFIIQIPKLSSMILNRNINEHLYQHTFLMASEQAIG